jgi:uncharacterized cupin superfamily protein
MKRVNIAAPSFEHDPSEPDGYRSAGMRLGPLLAAQQLGATVYELPPGESICPYHYEHAEEEWLLVLSGTPLLRHPDGSDTLDPWDVVCFENGPAGAHKLTNATDQPVRVLMFSTVIFPAVTVYPDSDKIGVWTDGGRDNVVVRRSSGGDYWDGETTAS